MHFEFASADRIVFGADALTDLAPIVSSLGSRVFAMAGSTPDRHRRIFGALNQRGLTHTRFGVVDEPTTDIVTTAVETARRSGADVVLTIGGGSVIDAGKVVAAMLTNEGTLEDYLEVVGRGKRIERPAAPHVAVPTTAGTGAEVTRNAVIGVPQQKVKVSMRSPLLLPTVAFVDPRLTHSMSPALTASTGLDALTQLIEAFVSNKANPLTDGLCREGLKRAGRSLGIVFRDGSNVQGREDMALASLFSGLALANAGLGAVHGFAGPLGGMIGAPHGLICGRLLPHVIRANVEALGQRGPDAAALERFDEIARILTQHNQASAIQAVEWIERLCKSTALPSLRTFGLDESSFSEAVAKAKKASSMKGNPIELRDEELIDILHRATG
jgi:alcohol dehydrogenase class IV